MLSSFTVENYRAFAREQTIEIRPLTLFFGWNSGGKSALVRFLPLLVESIKAAGSPIWLGGEVGRGATWPELVCKTTKRTSLKFGLHLPVKDLPDKLGEPDSFSERMFSKALNGIGAFDAEWEVAGDLDGKWQQTTSICLKRGDNERKFIPTGSIQGEWEGLPLMGDNAHGAEGNRLIIQLGHVLRQLLPEVQWVGGVRIRPPRLATYGGGMPPPLKADGSNAIDHLIAAQLRSMDDPELIAVREFFFALGEELVLDNPMVGAWRVMLRPPNAPDVKVNICDTGEGYAQVLPVLVALARARFGGPRLLCLEQPELHLHTRAQAALAKILVQTALAETEPSILLETHSEVLLTSIQLAIANGEIAPDKVRVYWIESRADGTSDVLPVDFDAQGLPNNSTLAGAFNEAVALGRQLLMKQMGRQNKVSEP